MSDENKNIENVGRKPNLPTKILRSVIVFILFPFFLTILVDYLYEYNIYKGNFETAYKLQKKMFYLTNISLLKYSTSHFLYWTRMTNIKFMCGNLKYTLSEKKLIVSELEKLKKENSELYFNNILDIAFISFLIGNYSEAHLYLNKVLNENSNNNYNLYGKSMNLYLLMGYEDIATKYYTHYVESNPKNSYDIYSKQINILQYNLIKNNINNCNIDINLIENFLKTEPMLITKIHIYLNLAEYYAKKEKLTESQYYLNLVQKHLNERISEFDYTKLLLTISRIRNIYDKNYTIFLLEKNLKESSNIYSKNKSNLLHSCSKYYIQKLKSDEIQKNILCENLSKIGGNY